MKSALVIWGGWDGHQPKATVDRFVPFLKEQGYQVAVSDTLSSLDDPAALLSLSLIVPCWTMGELKGDQEKHLLDAVRNGVGIAGWHGGMGDAFRSQTDYQFMVGGQFVGHPGGCIDYTVNIVKKEDPIVTGLPDFQMRSECYYMHVDPSNDLLATTTFTGEHCPWIAGCVMPVVWKRTYGAGRVFYASFGHAPSDFDVPEAFEIMKRGMCWASR
jgi:uncharacterized protein